MFSLTIHAIDIASCSASRWNLRLASLLVALVVTEVDDPEMAEAHETYRNGASVVV